MDNIRPEHYTKNNGIYEPIKIIRHYKLNFELGNVIKYILRAGKKSKHTHIEDLNKAIQYLKFEIERLELENNEEINKK